MHKLVWTLTDLKKNVLMLSVTLTSIILNFSRSNKSFIYVCILNFHGGIEKYSPRSNQVWNIHGKRSPGPWS